MFGSHRGKDYDGCRTWSKVLVTVQRAGLLLYHHVTDNKMRGRLIHKTFDYDNGRQAVAYACPENAEALIYTGDGQLVESWAETLEKANILNVVIIGTYRLEDEMQRLHEYSPVFDAARFEAHEKFFTQDIPEWMATSGKQTFSRERTWVFGVSAGGELALAMGLRHPELYSTILCASPGAGYKPEMLDEMPKPLPRAYFVGGTEEEFFYDNAKRWADALKAAGGDVVIEKREGGHGGEFWKQEFPKMVAWAFKHSASKGA